MMGTKAHVRDDEGLAVLDEVECLRLLADGYTGRLALIEPDGRPLILPVNYRIDDEHRIVIRTTDGPKLDAARRNAPVAFEIDGTDDTYHEGWSVVVRGELAHVTAEDELDALQHLALRPWAKNVARDHWIRIGSPRITGRRIVGGDQA
jgi:nitroimidazol reductase NimA-like FMN-containing flavoprotein (pyridoxamine 5'-phosphate oxidase superfamily)